MGFPWKSPQSRQDKEEIVPQNNEYSKLSAEQILEKFKSENWGNMDDDKRIALFQEMENRNAYFQGREPAKIAATNSDEFYGTYNNVFNRIEINVSNVSSYEALDTYVHESNHAYQTNCVENGTGYEEHMLNMMQAETARTPQGHLYNYENDSPYYDMQCNELDSNNQAAKFLIGQKSRYANDSEYRTYIVERSNHFQKVNATMKNAKELRNAMQIEQTKRAYLNGDISEEQFLSMVQNIQNKNYEDAAAKESYLVENELVQMKDEFSKQETMQSKNTENSNSNNNVEDGMGI